jgi:hypothetical protein
MSTPELAALAAETSARCNWCERTDTQPAWLTLDDDDGKKLDSQRFDACPEHVAQLIAFVDAAAQRAEA